MSGGKLIGDGVGRGGAFFASTRITGLDFALGLGTSWIENSFARGDGCGASKDISNDLARSSLVADMAFSRDGNVGLGIRGAMSDVGVEIDQLGEAGGWPFGVRGGFGSGELRVSDRSNPKPPHLENGRGLRSSVRLSGESSKGTGGRGGCRPRGRPFMTGKSPSIGVLAAKGLMGTRSMGGRGASSVRI